jgi:hypothetical protein
VDDQRLITDVVYGEWARLRPWQRARSHWLTDGTMVEWLERLFPPYPSQCYQPGEEPPRSQSPMLLGKPVEIRDGAEGCQLVVDGDAEPGSVFA